MQPRDKLRLEHMLSEARKAVAKGQAVCRADLDTDENLVAAFAWHLSVIGEAASRLSTELRQTHSMVPWAEIVGMRHRLVHGYDAIDFDIVWQTLQVDLPPLVAALEEILRSEQA